MIDRPGERGVKGYDLGMPASLSLRMHLTLRFSSVSQIAVAPHQSIAINLELDLAAL